MWLLTEKGAQSFQRGINRGISRTALKLFIFVIVHRFRVGGGPRLTSSYKTKRSNRGTTSLTPLTIFSTSHSTGSWGIVSSCHATKTDARLLLALFWWTSPCGVAAG